MYCSSRVGKRKEIHCLKSKSNSETSARQNGKRLAKCNFQFIDKNLIKRMSEVIWGADCREMLTNIAQILYFHKQYKFQAGIYGFYI